MPTTVADVKAPKGLIEPALFLDVEDSAALDVRLQGYIDDGEIQADAVSAPGKHDEAVRAWVYYRAFQSVYIRLSGTPSTVDIKDEGSTSFLITQIQHFRDLASEQRAAFDAILASVEEVVTSTPPPRIVGSSSMAVTPRW